MATPFVQGRLSKTSLTVTIETVCSHCDRPMKMTVSSDMQVSVEDKAARPLVFMPDVDWKTFTEPNIIGTY